MPAQSFKRKTRQLSKASPPNHRSCGNASPMPSKPSSRRSTSSTPPEKIKLREVSEMEADIKQMKKNGNVSEAQITVAQTMLDQLKTHQESIEGITLWMDEVSNFLNAEDASAFGGGGDDTNLDTQLKDSNALLEDIKTLKSKLGSINSSGLELCSKCAEDDFRLSLQHELETINSKWNEIEKMAEDQNTRLASASSRSQKITNNIQEIEINRQILVRTCVLAYRLM